MSNPTQDNASEPRNVSYPTTTNFYGNNISEQGSDGVGFGARCRKSISGDVWELGKRLSRFILAK